MVKNDDNQWYECNDKKITLIKDGISKADTEQAYILFYQKRVCESVKGPSSTALFEEEKHQVLV